MPRRDATDIPTDDPRPIRAPVKRRACARVARTTRPAWFAALLTW